MKNKIEIIIILFKANQMHKKKKQFVIKYKIEAKI